jgi:hypothetical protein
MQRDLAGRTISTNDKPSLNRFQERLPTDGTGCRLLTVTSVRHPWARPPGIPHKNSPRVNLNYDIPRQRDRPSGRIARPTSPRPQPRAVIPHRAARTNHQLTGCCDAHSTSAAGHFRPILACLPLKHVRFIPKADLLKLAVETCVLGK